MRLLAAALVLLLAGCSSPQGADAPTDSGRTSTPSDQAEDVGDVPAEPLDGFPIRIQGRYVVSGGCSLVPLSQLPSGIVSDLKPVPAYASGHPYTTSGSGPIVNSDKCLAWLDAAGQPLLESVPGQVPDGAAQVFVTAMADAANVSYEIEITA